MGVLVRNTFSFPDNLTIESTGPELRTGRVDTNTGASIYTSAGKLVLVTGGTGGYSGTDRTSIRYVKPVVDGEMLVTLQPWEAIPEIVARADDMTGADIPNMVKFLLDYDDTAGGYLWKLQTVTGTWTAVDIGSVPMPTYDPNDPVSIRLRVIGSAVSVKVWPAPDPEPSAWSITGTTTLTAAGSWGVVAAPDDGQWRTLSIDYFALTDGTADTWSVRNSMSGADFDGPVRKQGADLITGGTIQRIIPITAAEYTALGTKRDPNTLYALTDDHTVRVG